MATGGRTVNARGQGMRLREEITAAATRLLARTASRDAVTLRAIAREAGIAAPSIYKQFADRDAILDAVVSATFEQLHAACADAIAAQTTGRRRIRALSQAYVAFAREHPGEYRILFERSHADTVAPPHAYPEGIELFGCFIAAFEQANAQGESHSADPVSDAQALWAALHGLVTLPPSTPGFPWSPEATLLDRLVDRLSDSPQ